MTASGASAINGGEPLGGELVAGGLSASVFGVLLRALSFIVVSVLFALLPASPAFAQDPGDPSAGSPPGVVYQLPLDRGRGDAAPTRKGGQNGSGGGSGNQSGSGSGSGSSSSGESDGADPSFYRSENNFGSSSRVPGVGGGAGGTGGAAGEGVPALPTAADVDSGSTSVPETVGLLALIGAVGTGIAFMAIRSRRQSL
jgi:hypothetical protein